MIYKKTMHKNNLKVILQKLKLQPTLVVWQSGLQHGTTENNYFQNNNSN